MSSKESSQNEQSKSLQLQQSRSGSALLLLIAKGILRGSAIAADILFVAMLLVMFANVILRYVAGRPLYWGDEVIINLTILMVYAGLGFVLIEGGHVRMTAVFSKLTKKTQNVLWVITSLLGVGYGGLILYAVIRLVIESLQIGSFSPSTRWPIAPWQMVVALGLILLLLAFVMMAAIKIYVAFGIHEEEQTETKPPEY